MLQETVIYGNTILTTNSKKDLQVIMPEIKCPKCNTLTYDNTSFFCYRCGAQLSANIPEKALDLRKGRDYPKYYKAITPERKSGIIRDDLLSAPKPAPLQPLKPEPGDDFFPEPKPAPAQQVKPVEICAHCGGPITSKNNIFCESCGVNIREELSGGVSSIVNHPVLNPRVSTPVSTPVSIPVSIPVVHLSVHQSVHQSVHLSYVKIPRAEQ